VCVSPALTAAKVPSGATDSPQLLSPQQIKVPVVLNPQLWLPALVIAVNGPGGGGFVSPDLLEPQQATAPAMLRAQVWS
jgi:hypothetical protein